jgi:hypothetical protein
MHVVSDRLQHIFPKTLAAFEEMLRTLHTFCSMYCASATYKALVIPHKWPVAIAMHCSHTGTVHCGEYLFACPRAGRCKSTCMNSMQTGIMPCATFRTVPFQRSSSHSFENFAIRTFRALVFSKAHSHSKCISAKWQHDNGGAWLKV